MTINLWSLSIAIWNSVDLILEAFKDQVPLRILELPNLLLLLQLIVFHGRRNIISISGIFWMEHMGTQIQDCLLVLALLIILTNLSLTEGVNKLADAVDKVGLVKRLREPLLWEIGKAD